MSRMLDSASDESGLLPERVTPQRLYRELKAVASAYLRREDTGHTLQPTALVHEALIRLAREVKAEGAAEVDALSARWGSPAEFFRLAAVAMQRVLIEHARSKNAVRRGGAGRRAGQDPARARARRVSLTEAAGEALEFTLLNPVQLRELQSGLEAFAVRDPRAAEVVRFRFFAGLTMAETARALGVAPATAEADWRIARAWLGRRLGVTA